MEIITTDIATLQTEIIEFVKELKKEKLADQLQTQLTIVGDSLSTAPNPWSDVDVYKVFNPAMFFEIGRNIFRERIGWIAFFDLIRNVLILLPIILTWFALSEASAAYHTMAGANEALWSQPFLLQWQNGFAGNLPAIPVIGIPTFSNIAIWDSIIISVIFLSTLIVHTSENWWLNGKERELLRLTDRLDIILFRLSFIFKAQQQPMLQSSEQRSIALLTSIKEFMDEFKQQGFDYQNLIVAEQERLTRQADLHQQELVTIRSFSEEFRHSIESLAMLTPTLAAPLANLEKAVFSLSNETGQIQFTNSRLLDAIQAFEGYFGSFEGIVNSLSQDLGSAAKAVSDTSNVYGGKLGEIIRVVDHLANTTDMVTAGQVKLQEALVAEKMAAESWVSEIRRSSEGIQGSTSKIAIYTDQLGSFGSTLETLSQQNSDLARQIKALQLSTDSLVSPLNNVDRVTSGLVTRLEPTDQNIKLLSQSMEGFTQKVNNIGQAMAIIADITRSLGIYADQIKGFGDELKLTNQQGAGLGEQYHGLSLELSELRKQIAVDQIQNRETTASYSSAVNQIDTFAKNLDIYLASQQKSAETSIQLSKEFVRLREVMEKVSSETNQGQKPGGFLGFLGRK